MPQLFWTSPKNICSIFVTFTKSDGKMKCAMLNYKRIKNKVKLKESCFYSPYQIIRSGAKLKSSVLIGDFWYSGLTGVCCQLIGIRAHCTNFLPQENLLGTKPKTTNWEVYWAATISRSLRKNVLPKILAFLDFFLSFYTCRFFSLVFIFRRWKKIHFWNTAHFLHQTKNPLCEGVDSITQLLSCVPRLKKLHLVILWWCSVSERILSVQDTASLLNIFLAVCEDVHGISQHLIQLLWPRQNYFKLFQTYM